MANTVLVVGTGTIGEPLIGLMSRMKDELGIDNVLFNKHSPNITDRPMVNSLLKAGAELVVKKGKRKEFTEIGLDPTMNFQEALNEANVVIDCTPKGIGIENKEKYYLKHKDNIRGFIAQGSEAEFGALYAAGINDLILKENDHQFLTVCSCNTHNISVIIKDLCIEGKINEIQEEAFAPQLQWGRFHLLRRANDISQTKSFVAAPHVDPPTSKFGSHHARDAYNLFQTIGLSFDLHSSSMKLNSQYMHVVYFRLKLRKKISLEGVIDRFDSDPWVALTNKLDTNLVFSFGREHGYYGRILDQAVIVVPSLSVIKDEIGMRGYEVSGYSFTPQDGNSLLSSITATLHFMSNGESLQDRLKPLSKLRFDEV